MQIGKKKITIARVGFVKFGKKRIIKKIKLAIFLSFMVVLNVIFLFLPFTGLNLRLNAFTTMLLIGTIFIILPISIVAYYLQFERLYLIGIMGGLGLSITGLLRPLIGSPLNTIITFSSIGGIITIWGIVILVRFLKQYPIPEKDQI